MGTSSRTQSSVAAGGASAPSRRSAVLAAVLALTSVASLALGMARAPSDPEIGSPVVEVLLTAGMLVFAIVGAVVAWKRPSNPIGWLLLSTGFVMCTGFVGAGGYAADPSLPGSVYAKWYTHITGQSPAIFTFFAFFLLLFPDGRLPTRRWRHLARFSVSVTVVFTLFIGFKPGELAESRPPTANPFALSWIAPVWKIVELPLFFGVMVCIPLAAVSFVLRFRRSRNAERQQLKWFAFSAVIVGMAVAVAPAMFMLESLQKITWLWPLIFFFATTSVPVAAGIAVLRYRLYDIDRIISRTFSYVLVNAVLGGTFALLVLLPSVLVGADDTSDYVIAAATLVVAALFRPVRRRVQGIVDRRFNRARYDAARTVEAFAGRLRDQIDIDTLGAELQIVVGRTMQPSSLALWLRG